MYKREQENKLDEILDELRRKLHYNEMQANAQSVSIYTFNETIKEAKAEAKTAILALFPTTSAETIEGTKHDCHKTLEELQGCSICNKYVMGFRGEDLDKAIEKCNWHIIEQEKEIERLKKKLASLPARLEVGEKEIRDIVLTCMQGLTAFYYDDATRIAQAILVAAKIKPEEKRERSPEFEALNMKCPKCNLWYSRGFVGCPYCRIEAEKKEETCKHIIEEGSHEHVLRYDSKGVHCSEPNCEVNKTPLPAQEKIDKPVLGIMELPLSASLCPDIVVDKINELILAVNRLGKEGER